MNTFETLNKLAELGFEIVPHVHAGTRSNQGATAMVRDTAITSSGRTRGDVYDTLRKGTVGDGRFDRAGRFDGTAQPITDDESEYVNPFGFGDLPVAIATGSALLKLAKAREVSAYKLNPNGRHYVVLNLPGLRPVETCIRKDSDCQHPKCATMRDRFIGS